ncbi:MAG: TlpA family protein disulfide reductase [Bacteroidetes bacterium]|nr:TlpA family protein disulfide reductase [Bacteroidota bacterium]
MIKIKEKITNYLNKKSIIGVVSDIVFALLIIALLIPSSRKEIIVGVKKILLFQPGIEKNTQELQPDDYQWAIQDLDGTMIPFSSFQAKIVFLNTWATWCPHCIAEFPGIQRLYNEYGTRVEFIILSHEKPATVRAFLEKEGYDFPVYLTYGNIAEVFDSRSLPTTFLISQEGKILINKKGSARWDGEKVKNLLDALLSK